MRGFGLLLTLALIWPPLAVAQNTPWGDPDLQGVWRYEAAISLERPRQFEGRELLTDAEVAERERTEKEQAANRLAGLEGAAVGRRSISESPIRGNEYNSFWQDHGRPRKIYRQTSLIVDPPNGRLPAITAAAEKRRKEARGGRGHTGEWRGDADSFEDLNIYYRCLTRGLLGSIIPVIYGNGNEIVQGPGYVVIRHEMIHEARVIPLDGTARLNENVKGWIGSSRGRWEGDTLVVETTNFNGKNNYRGSTTGLHLIERYTRTDPNTLTYQVTVEDPTTWTRPWTFNLPWERDRDYRILEYACHEGNIALANSLRGERVLEAEATKKGEAGK
jgi:hypothetical protein